MDYKTAISLSAFICHSIMMNQIFEIESLFECSKRIFKDISRDNFNEVIDLLNKDCAITGITDKYIYQTSSTLKQQKTIEQIMDALKK